MSPLLRPRPTPARERTRCRSSAARCPSGPVRPASAQGHPTPPARPSAKTGHRPSSTCRRARACRATGRRPAEHRASRSESADCPPQAAPSARAPAAEARQPPPIPRPPDPRKTQLLPRKQPRLPTRAPSASLLSTGPWTLALCWGQLRSAWDAQGAMATGAFRPAAVAAQAPSRRSLPRAASATS